MADVGYGAMPIRGYPEDTERKLRGYLVKLADQDVSAYLAAFGQMLCAIGDSRGTMQDFHVANDLPALAHAIKRDWADGNQGVFEGFAIG